MIIFRIIINFLCYSWLIKYL